jgi:[ribosomal protein S5]-alanine N-acetyltransferase
MAFLRLPFAPDLPPAIAGGPVTLRVPEVGDYLAWADLRMRSRAFLTPWEPSWPPDDLTRAAFRARIKRYTREIAADHAYPFFIFRADDLALLGGVTLSNLRRGVAQSASLGYWIGAPFARKGYMTASVNALAEFAFASLHLHRVEAACLPSNAASIALLRACGFNQEGLARSYLKITGIWQDHLLFARVNGEDRS